MSEANKGISRRDFLKIVGALVGKPLFDSVGLQRGEPVSQTREIPLTDLEEIDGKYEVIIAPGEEVYIQLLQDVAGESIEVQVHIDQLPLTNPDLGIRLYIGDRNPLSNPATQMVYYSFPDRDSFTVESTTDWGAQPLRKESLDGLIEAKVGATIRISLSPISVNAVGGQTIRGVDSAVYIDDIFVTATTQSYEANHIGTKTNQFWLVAKNYGSTDATLNFGDIQSTSTQE